MDANLLLNFVTLLFGSAPRDRALLRKVTDLLTTGTEIDSKLLEPVMCMETPGGLIAGSAVAVAEHWAMSAAHCFRQEMTGLRLRNPDDTRAATVEAIHWRDGDSFEFGKSTIWPVSARSKGGRRDELVLLRTREPIADAKVSALIDWQTMSPKEAPLLAGFGEDDQGNYPRRGTVILLEYFADTRERRGALRRVPGIDDLIAAMTLDAKKTDPPKTHPLMFNLPYQDYSGGPVLQGVASISELRLRGIHVSRARAGEVAPFESQEPMEQVACFLPLLPGDRPWFDRLVLARSNIGNSPARLVDRFTLRDRYLCKTLGSAMDIGGTWRLHDVSGKAKFLGLCGTVVVMPSATGDSARVEIADKSGINRVAFNVTPAYVDGVGLVAFAGVHKASAQSPAFYLFLENSGEIDGKEVRRIRIEVFVKGTTERKPSKKNIKANWDDPNAKPMTITHVCKSNSTAHVPLLDPEPPELGDDDDDQDEEGDGYEEN